MCPTQVSETVCPRLVGGSAEVPEPEEVVSIQEPVAIADGDRGEDQGQGSADNDEDPDEGFQEGPLGPPLGQQPLGLEDIMEGMSGKGPCSTPPTSSGKTLVHAPSFPKP